MNALHGPKPIRSIKARVIFPLVGTITVAMLVMAGFILLFTRNQGQNAEEISSKALRTQAENYLMELNQAGAKENNLILERVRQDADKLATYAARLFDHPETFNSTTYWDAASRMSKGADGQYFNGKDDPSSVFIPNIQPVTDQMRRDLEISAYLDFIFEAVYKNDSNVGAIYFATPSNIIRYYPNVGLGDVLAPDFRATERVWYTGSTLQNDPLKKSWWTPVYPDTTGQDLVTTAAAPIYNEKQEFIGAVGLDISLKEIAGSIEKRQFLGSGYTFLIDQTGKAIALPEQGYTDLLSRSPKEGETGADLSEASSVFAPVLEQMKTGQTGFQTLVVNGKELFIAYAPIETTGWSLGSVVNSKDIFQVVSGMRTEMNQSTRTLLLTLVLPVIGAILLIAALLGWIISKRIADPVQKFARAAQLIGAGHWNVELPVKNKDEIGILAREMRSMASRLQSSIAQLEDRVADRTRDLERRSAELQVAAELARDTTAVYNLDEMLAKAVNLIRERFGFYHAGVFLIDEKKEYAILKAATGEAGQELMNQDYRLKIGETGIISIVASTGQPRITLDVDADPAYFHNPLLPETHSEMALPLKAGGEIIGVLNIQSTESAAFQQEDLLILQIVADQLSVAIQNTTLFEEMTETLRQLSETQSGTTQISWRKMIQQRGAKAGYAYHGLSLKPTTEQTAEAASAIRTGKTTYVNGASGQTKPTLAVPLKIRDQVIGAIDLKFKDQALAPETLSTFEEIAGRLSLALESSRLLEETQLRTEQIHLLQEITAAAATHLEMDELMQEVSEMVRQGFELSRCSVLFFDARQKSAAFVSESEAYRIEQKYLHPGQPIPITEDSLFREMIDTQRTTVLYDFQSRDRTETLKSFVHSEGLATLILSPLTERGEVIGAILMESTDEKRRFSPEDLQLLDQIGLQVSVAIDVVRMFEQARLRAEREKTIAELNSRVRASTNVDVILQTSITELSRILHVKKGSIQLQAGKGRVE